jgi:hypothetical protein
MWETNLEHQEEMLAELEELHECVAEVGHKRAVKAVKLSGSIMEISNTLVNLGVLSIRDIPTQPWSAQDVLTAAGLILEHL